MRDKVFYKEAKQLGDKLKSYTKKEMEGRVFTLTSPREGTLLQHLPIVLHLRVAFVGFRRKVAMFQILRRVQDEHGATFLVPAWRESSADLRVIRSEHAHGVAASVFRSKYPPTCHINVSLQEMRVRRVAGAVSKLQIVGAETHTTVLWTRKIVQAAAKKMAPKLGVTDADIEEGWEAVGAASEAVPAGKRGGKTGKKGQTRYSLPTELREERLSRPTRVKASWKNTDEGDSLDDGEEEQCGGGGDDDEDEGAMVEEKDGGDDDSGDDSDDGSRRRLVGDTGAWELIKRIMIGAEDEHGDDRAEGEKRKRQPTDEALEKERTQAPEKKSKAEKESGRKRLVESPEDAPARKEREAVEKAKAKEAEVAKAKEAAAAEARERVAKMLEDRKASGAFVPGSHWELVRSNTTSKCVGCSDIIRPLGFRMVYQPDLSTIFLRGNCKRCHHIDAGCLERGGCPLYAEKKDFGYTVPDAPPGVGEPGEEKTRKTEEARDKAVTAAKEAAARRATAAASGVGGCGGGGF